MRLSSNRVSFLSEIITDTLIKEGYIIYPGGTIKDLNQLISDGITKELMVEQIVEDEVKEIMEEHYNEIDGANADYRKMFNMIKSKLIRKKGIVI